MPRNDSDTILLVDDDPSVRRVLSTQLRHRGYQVLEANNGRSALSIVASDVKIDLLLTDVVMEADMNGVDLFDEAIRLRSDLRTLLMSGYVEEAVGDKIVNRGLKLLKKPYAPSALDAAIRQELGTRQPGR